MKDKNFDRKWTNVSDIKSCANYAAMWSHQTIWVTSVQSMLRDKIGYRRESQTVFNLLYLVDCGHEGWLGDESSLNTKFHRLMINLGNCINIRRRCLCGGKMREGTAASSRLFCRLGRFQRKSRPRNGKILAKGIFTPFSFRLPFATRFEGSEGARRIASGRDAICFRARAAGWRDSFVAGRPAGRGVCGRFSSAPLKLPKQKRQPWVQGYFRGLTHLDGANGLPGVAHEEGDVAELGHRCEELQVVGQARLVLERRLRLVLRQRLASNRIDTKVGHVDCGETVIQSYSAFKVN